MSTAASDGAQHERRESPEAIGQQADRLGALARWLRCPRCSAALTPGPAPWTLVCTSAHAYDANKRGFVNLVDRSKGITGDTREILQARDRFLASGHYSPIVAVLDELITPLTGHSSAILDSGCGTGYYLGALLATRPGWDPLALDVSADAVAMAARATGSPGLVADLWKPLPLRSDRADIVLCVFAPRNAAEFARVLRPDGSLIVVTPRQNHLAQLRERGRLIGIQPDKRAHLDDTLAAEFTLADRRPLEYDVGMSRAQQADLGTMGPSGHHAALGAAASEDDETDAAGDAETVTIAVDVSVYRPRRS